MPSTKSSASSHSGSWVVTVTYHCWAVAGVRRMGMWVVIVVVLVVVTMPVPVLVLHAFNNSAKASLSETQNKAFTNASARCAAAHVALGCLWALLSQKSGVISQPSNFSCD
jgi:hypothetical protein